MAEPNAREPLTPEGAARAARIARALVDGALANLWVQEHVRDLNPWHGAYGLWTVEKVKANPPVRVEFEYCDVFGGVGEALAAARGKSTFGQFVGVFPVEPEDPVGELNVMFRYKSSSPYNRRVEQRRYLKTKLEPTGWRRLVRVAMGMTKGEFLKRIGAGSADPMKFAGARDALRMAFGPAVELGDFWRWVKGKVWLDLPAAAPPAPALFDAGPPPEPGAKPPRPKRVRAVRPATPGLFDDEPAVSG